MKKLTVAQIGVGYWGPNLLRNLVANSHCAVRRVVDLAPSRRDFVRKHYPSILVSANASSVLNDSEIQAVVIATPVKTHFHFARQALQQKKHVLVEKPLATSVREVEILSSIAKKNKLVLMVGHTFLYNPAVRYVKRLIDSGALGKIRYIYSQRLSLGRIRSDVNALWNFAPHDVSIVQYWLNNRRPRLVTKQGMDYIQKGVEDVFFMEMVYPNKVMAHFHVSWLDPQKVRRITIVGSKKMVVYDDVSDRKIAIYDKGIDRMAILGRYMDFDKKASPQFLIRSGNVVFPKIKFEEPLKIEITHFVDCIRRGTPCLTGPQHARAVVDILAR